MLAAYSTLVPTRNKPLPVSISAHVQPSLGRKPARRWLVRLGALLALSAGTLLPAQAKAQCVPINSPVAPAGDAALFSVEGKITAFNRAARTITANGMTFILPTGLGVATNGLGLPANLTFEAFTDPALEATRSIIGATVIADGTNSVTGAGNCVSFSATSVFVEMAENVLLGVLHDVDTVHQTFHVNGALVRMNPDPRFPSALLDLGGKPISIAGLVGFEGTPVSAEGYFDTTTGILNATLAETSAVPKTPGTDAVAISRALLRAGGELRVDGQVVANSTGQLATRVDVFSGTVSGTKCSGALLGSATPAADTTFAFRIKRGATATSVCVKSPLGGIADRATTPR
jgi:hypothetical protein